MIKVDVAVIGAGIIGCLTARELAARSPELTIAVFDRDIAGSGASRRSAGVHFPRGRTDRVRRMSAFSHDYFRTLLANEPQLPIFPLALSLLSSCPDIVAEVYLEVARLTPSVEVPTDIMLPPGESAWSGEGCNYADVGLLTAMLARHLRPHIRFFEGVAVTAIEPGPEQVILRLSTGEDVVAAAVALAPGPWLDRPAWSALVKPLGARVKKVVAVHVDQAAVADDQLVVFHDEDAFLMPMVNRNQWLFSYTSQHWDVDPDELAAELSPTDLAEARACLSRYASRLADRIHSGRVFCDAYSSDGEPIVRALDAAERIVFVGAANGSGYRLAPAIAAEAVALLNPYLIRSQP